MKTPVLNLQSKHNTELLDRSIKSYLDTIACCTHLHNKYEATLMSMFQNLCYKVFFTGTTFSPNKRYTIADACQYLPGIFRTEMIDLLHLLIKYMLERDERYLCSILRNCYSYELLQILYSKPVRVYAAILGHLALSNNDLDIFDICVYYLDNESKQPTLDWEMLYLKYMERYE